MTNSLFAEFQTDNLMLLMGTNPLPNYVAAKLLTKPETRLREKTKMPDTSSP